jgi:glycosyltransferase involved in cell wall biosynthesis
MIFDDQVYCFDGKAYGSDEAFILFIVALRRYFQSLILCSRLYPETKAATYTIPGQKIKVCALPYYKSLRSLLSQAMIYLPQIWRLIKRNIDDCDMLWLTWPHPVSLLMLIQARRARKFPFLVVRQNLKALVKQRYRGWQKVAAVLTINFLEWQLRLWGKGVVVFTLGSEMFEKFRRSCHQVHPIEISLLSKNEAQKFYRLTFGAHQTSSRLLFVGRLEPEKGLAFLLHALAILKAQNRNVHLDIVGSGMEEENLRKLAQKLDINDRVSFHGYIAFGDTLFSYYRAADFFVLPSLSEGIPQVLLEAMAFGVPIITTQIPSVQGIVRHKENSWLVEPGSAMALAKAIHELADNPMLADTLRQRATEDIYVHTMEFQQEKMLRILAMYLK